MSDVDALEDTLEISDVIEQAAIEHLYDCLEQTEHLFLLRGELKFAWIFVGGKQESVLSLDVTQCSSQSIHVLQ